MYVQTNPKMQAKKQTFKLSTKCSFNFYSILLKLNLFFFNTLVFFGLNDI